MARVRDRIRAYNTAVDGDRGPLRLLSGRLLGGRGARRRRYWDATGCTCRRRGTSWRRASALEALGLGDDALAHARRARARRRPLPERAAGHARWATGHLAPWLVRRARGRVVRRRRRGPSTRTWVQVRRPGRGLPSSGNTNIECVVSAERAQPRPRRSNAHDRHQARQARRARGPAAADREGYTQLRGARGGHPRAPAAGDAPRCWSSRSATSGWWPSSSGCCRRPTRLDVAARPGRRHRHRSGRGRRPGRAGHARPGDPRGRRDAWVRPVHPDEAFLDEERISATSPLAIALVGARTGHTVWVDAPDRRVAVPGARDRPRRRRWRGLTDDGDRRSAVVADGELVDLPVEPRACSGRRSTRSPTPGCSELAARVGISERAVQLIVADLERAGYVVKRRTGRRNHYDGDRRGCACGIRPSASRPIDDLLSIFA